MAQIALSEQWCAATYTCSVLLNGGVGIAGINLALNSSPTKVVKLQKVQFNGVATAGGQTVATLQYVSGPVYTGGTPSAQVAAPLDPRNGAASAVLNLYSAVPTGGVVVAYLKTDYWNYSTAGTAVTPLIWQFPDSTYSKCPTLRPTQQTQNAIPGAATLDQYVINLSAALGAGGNGYCTITWTEEVGV